MKLFARKECWAPTACGWLALAVVFLGLAALAFGSIYDFLAPTSPVAADVLIVEYWLPDYAMEGAVAEFKQGGYKYLILCGEELPVAWRSSSRFKTGGDLAAATLIAMGLETNRVIALQPYVSARDRTYSMALATGEWLQATNARLRAVNLYSLGPHARRSRLLYQKALGKKVAVGVFAPPSAAYDPKRWWSTSNGFRDVLGEAIAYLYARILFHPSTGPTHTRTFEAEVLPAPAR
jgi:hypothetical protein